MRHRPLFEADYKRKPRFKKRDGHRPAVMPLLALIIIILTGVVIASVSLNTPLDEKLTVDTSSLVSNKNEIIALPSQDSLLATAPAQPQETTVTTASLTSIDSRSGVVASDVEEKGTLESVTIRKGDTLSALFSRRGFQTELHSILALGKQVAQLRNIHPGQTIHIKTKGSNLDSITLDLDPLHSLEIVRHEDDYSVLEHRRSFDRRSKMAFATIDSSLYLAGQTVGLSDKVIMQLAIIFGWDIDFALDIRTGDQFTVVYEQLFLDDQRVKDGVILSAEFVNAGRSYRAVRYTDASGNIDYYSEDGHSMRKPFLRTPVDFARVSSGFNLNRRHPVLNTIRAHRGVDYAAATGTPIKAAGDGKIIHRGNKGGYGRTIILQHGSQYSTLYAHMRRYGKNLSVGSRVKQGQIIGYVGSSGLATGPHLHYEFRINGVHRNPLTVKLPDAKPLARDALQRFKEDTAERFARLELFSSTRIAQFAQ